MDAGTSSQLASQVPFNTQAPLTQLHGLSGDATSSLSSLLLSAEFAEAKTRSALPGKVYAPTGPLHGLANKDELCQHIGIPDMLNEQDLPASSACSVECQPYVLPISVTTVILDQPAPNTRPAIMQPFPLVDWIRHIRQDTSRNWPTASLRWARTISKNQQAILDEDDAWSPPLPGKTKRSGTVPISVLNDVTARVDSAFHTPEQGRSVSTLQVPIVTGVPDMGQDDGPQTQLMERESLSRSAISSGHSSDNDMLDSSQWPRSPAEHLRRPCVPPDTSPIRSPILMEAGGLHTATQKRLTPDSDTDEQSPEALISSPPSRQAVSDLISQIDLPTAPRTVFGQAANLCSDSNIELLKSPDLPHNNGSNELMPRLERLGNLSESPRRVARPKIQVKNTPFPKPTIQVNHTRVTRADIPHSSLVNATYPGPSPSPSCLTTGYRATLAPSQQVGGQGNRQSSILPSDGNNLTGLRPQNTPKRGFDQMRRPHTSADEDMFHSTTQLASATKARKDPFSGSQRRVNHASNKRPRTDERMAHHLTDPVFREFDERRILERRRTRQSLCNSIEPPHLRQTGPLRKSHTMTLSRSSTSSLPHTHVFNHAETSASIETSATNRSIHKAVSLDKDVSNAMRKFRALAPSPLSKFYHSFKEHYPSYPDDPKSFILALQHLRELRSQPREPHPSLWDDFVYRRAVDYKNHLQWCIDEGANALPFQDFYYCHVKRSERNFELITEEALRLVGNDEFLPENFDPCLLVTPDIAVHNGHTQSCSGGEARSPQALVTNMCLVEGHVTDDELVDSDEPGVQADNTRETSLKSHPIQIKVHPKKVNKRRSLPWSHQKGHHRVASPSAQALVDTMRSATCSSASEKVEDWLFTSRAPGIASPELEDPVRVGRSLTGRTAGGDIASVIESVTPNPMRASNRSDYVPAPVEKGQPESESELSSSVFAKFIRSYRSLQSEQRAINFEPRSRQSINVYNWC